MEVAYHKTKSINCNTPHHSLSWAFQLPLLSGRPRGEEPWALFVWSTDDNRTVDTHPNTQPQESNNTRKASSIIPQQNSATSKPVSLSLSLSSTNWIYIYKGDTIHYSAPFPNLLHHSHPPSLHHHHPMDDGRRNEWNSGLFSSCSTRITSPYRLCFIIYIYLTCREIDVLWTLRLILHIHLFT